MDIVRNEYLGELYIKTLPTGVKCYIIPMRGYVEKQMVFCTRYGSIDNLFTVGGKVHEMPKGIAHFLEHKLFEDEHVNIFNEFSKHGATVNAFTNFTATAYYFNCIDNFEENVNLLLDFVGKPYFTDENVEKEKGIISQEIDMYEDNPSWVVYFQMLRGMYHTHPIKENIAGTTESIQAITKDMLYDCYNTFYTPSNMAVICAGDVDPHNIQGLLDRHFEETGTQEVSRDYGEEPTCPKSERVTRDMPISIPRFCIGFKETQYGTQIPKKIAVTKLLLDIIAGESSSLYKNLYEGGIIDDSFAGDYMLGLNFGHSTIDGLSAEPDRVFSELMTKIQSFKNDGIDIAHFERIKKKHIGRFVRGFNFIDSITSSQVDYFTKDTDLLSMLSAYENATIDDLSERLHSHFTPDNAVLSVVYNQK